MYQSENPCLSLAIDRLSKTTLGAEHFAILVRTAPCPGGHVLHDCTWPEMLTQKWLAWQEVFSPRGLPDVPLVHQAIPLPSTASPDPLNANGQTLPYTARLMQDLGISLWKWLFNGEIQNSFAQSQGIAIGREKRLRLRLEILDPELIPVPWEIMQPEPGKQAISLSQQLLFSRTSYAVDPLPRQRLKPDLNILLVLGHDTKSEIAPNLQLEQEAEALANILERCGRPSLYAEGENTGATVLCNVDTLLQPTKAELISRLETENYNILFYAGHGVPAADGGLLFLRPDARINGTELAQVLVRRQVTLAVFNACWGAQPERHNQQSLPRSSLAEVLIHHGVPAVLGMRDSIADEEALSFIQAFAQALTARMPIDEAVAVARQKLLTLYKFNQPAWTLPILYMHPDFEGKLIEPETVTALPLSSAYLRSIGTGEVSLIRGTILRVGRNPDGNDLVIRKQEVSREHAEILCDALPDGQLTYLLKDISRYGTYILRPNNGWQEVYHREVPLQSGDQIKFGSMQSETWEFINQDRAMSRAHLKRSL
ncbi:CHAT domain-containing protein [Coleofasciculus sp. FACHB-1120]|uniref:CHAT domain-containing protein n=1 Tax=Coleofasciculus sp. FACHB-1120 TaxID=2692783 RepID=UPI00168986EA|nr:CHAT domain-containing protein [Coleofasciculus sp. FACHB-1120]MBD2743644.1 CHAT domain-containing protein [Coleofasciculus sp. FACHB-1120]